MSCSKHFLVFNWKQHEWEQQVTSDALLEEASTDMWGRQFPAQTVLCHKRYVCKDCGKVSGERDCICSLERGERCAPRLHHHLAGEPPRT